MLAIFGDHHASRSLPHSSSDKEGKNVRYEYMKKLMKESIEPFSYTIHLGDLTHDANFIDGKILEDYYEIFKDKKSLHLLGNHDKTGDRFVSMIEFLEKVIPGLKVVRDIFIFEINDRVFICTSYYANEDDIKAAVDDVLKTKKEVLVLGHWSFYGRFRKKGKKLKEFAKRKKVRWVLGHEHSPRKIKLGEHFGYYLGCTNPIQFPEKQGKVMLAGRDRINLVDYPMGEQFLTGYYTEEKKELPKFDNPEETYLRIIIDDKENVKKLNDKYGNIGLRHFSLPFESKEIMIETEDIKAETKKIDDYITIAANEYGYNPDKIIDYHEVVKNVVQKNKVEG